VLRGDCVDFFFIARSLTREVLLILLLLKRWPSSLVSLCKSLGLQNVVLEGDAKAVFEDQRNVYCDTALEVFLLFFSFCSCNFSHRGSVICSCKLLVM
jgi:hypothetical protein